MASPLRKLSWRVFHLFTQAHVQAFRASNGRVGRTYHGGPVLLLEHVGRKSGKRHTSPLIYGQDGDDLLLVASKGGSHKHPLWWLNLREHPDTTVHVPGERRRVRARQATPEEKARLWPGMVAIYAPYDDYQQRTERDIPVVILERA